MNTFQNVPTLKTSVLAISGNHDSRAKHCWHEKAPAIHAFTTSMWLDERALLTCMAYVDLNPIRAAMASSPETSDYTSIQERIKDKSSKLLPFGKGDDDLPYSLSSYLELVDYTGRAIVANKRGYIPPELPPILERLNLNPDTWLDELNSFKSIGITAVGTVDQLKSFCKQIGKDFCVGLKLIPALE